MRKKCGLPGELRRARCRRFDRARGSPLELPEITVAMTSSLVVGLVLGLQPPLAPRDAPLSRRAVLGAASFAVSPLLVGGIALPASAKEPEPSAADLYREVAADTAGRVVIVDGDSGAVSVTDAPLATAAKAAADAAASVAAAASPPKPPPLPQ